MNIGGLVDRLDQLVHLGPAQKSEAADVFKAENAALQAFATAEERTEKGSSIRERARTEIRALLTPEQRAIYDRAPQRLGGGAMQDAAAKVDRIDQMVELSDEQLAQVAEIYQKETDALLALPLSERAIQGAKFSQSAKTEVEALLTPRQKLKLAANPNLVPDLAERAYVTSFIKSSSAIAARLGVIAHVSLKGANTYIVSSDDRVESTKGSYNCNVRGSSGRELLKIYWEREPSTGEIKIIKIESGAGAALPL
jgi:hypothetical protein